MCTAYLNIVADRVHPFMTTVYPSSDCYLKQDNTASDKTRTISIWFLEHDNEFTVLQWPPQLLYLNPIVHLWDVLERESHSIDEKPTSAATGPKSLRNVSTTLLIVCHKELRHFWRHKVVSILLLNDYMLTSHWRFWNEREGERERDYLKLLAVVRHQ